MLVVADALHASDLPHGAVATIGVYDGVHRGQQEVLRTVVRRARELGGPAVVVTFDPHPRALLSSAGAPPRLVSQAQKERLLAALGVDAMLVLRFDRELAECPARDFVTGFLHRRLGLREIWVGAGFTFGHRRSGDLALLAELGGELGFAAHAVEPVMARGERISSTRIRRLLGEGRVEEAADLLGRPHAVTGTVARGDRMGKKLGWPTINLRGDEQLVPGNGVYAGRVTLASFPGSFEAAVNVGTRPTVYEQHQRVIEAHILDFESDVYGDRAEIAFVKRLREERTFPTIVDLAAQIGRDVKATRELFQAQRRREPSVAADEAGA